MKNKSAAREKTYHLLFEAGIIIKGVIALCETALGILFYSVSASTLHGIFYFFAGDEPTEHPPDFYWSYIVQGYHSFATNGQSFWAFIFISHGLLNLFLVYALLKNKTWAYPAAATVFSLFVIYQIYTFIFAPALSLALFSIFDIVVITLILHEYGRKKRSISAPV